MALSLKHKKSGNGEVSLDVKDHIAKYRKYYKPGVLQYESHNRFVMNIGFYADMAGVPEHFLYHPAKTILHKKDLDYLTKWFKLGANLISGGVYTGVDPNIMDRMYAIIGVLLRNNVDARFITAQDLLSELKSGGEVNNTMVCVPNFCLPKNAGGNIAPWESATILGWVLSRHGNGKQTLLYSESYDLIESQYGMTLKNHIDNNFKVLS